MVLYFGKVWLYAEYTLQQESKFFLVEKDLCSKEIYSQTLFDNESQINQHPNGTPNESLFQLLKSSSLNTVERFLGEETEQSLSVIGCQRW